MIALQDSNLESLLEEAKEHEKKYDWLQAAKNYKKASESLSETKDFLNASELQRKAGFCYYRAAMQTKTNAKFRSVLKHSILAYEKVSKLLERTNNEKYQVEIQHAQAMIAYMRSWQETEPKKVKSLLDKWWNLENQVLEAYKSIGNIHAVGVVCNDLIEYSQYTRLWLSTHSEEVKLEKEVQSLAEKAIQALLKSGDNYELARAYCFASIWYCSQSHGEPEFMGKRAQLLKKGYVYSKKALTLSSKTEDAWLISCAYHSACVAAIWYNHNYALAVDYGKEAQKYARVAKDNLLLSLATWYTSYAIRSFAGFLENPDKQRTRYEKAGRLGQECIRLSQPLNHMVGICWGCFHGIGALLAIAKSTTNPEKKQKITQNAINMVRECLEVLKGWKRLSAILYGISRFSLSLLSETKSDVEEKKALLLEAQSYQQKQIVQNEEFVPFLYLNQSWAYTALALVQIDLAKTETEKTWKVEFFEKAITNLEKSGELLAKETKLRSRTKLIIQVEGSHNDKLGRTLQQIYYLTNEEKTRCRAIEAYKNAVEAFMKGELPAHAAESYWIMAQLQGQKGEHQLAFQNYESASQAYAQAANKIPQLKDFYNDYSSYMQAWNQIEQAKYSHSIEEYNKAKEHYKKAAEIHKSTEQWGYLVPNYFAWANIEEAEGLSRKENIQQAKQTFQKALEQFGRAEESFKQKLEEITTSEEKEMTEKLFEASYVRRKYCKARILLEEAKLLDRDGKHLQSSTKYREAAQNISIIVNKIDVRVNAKN